MSAPTQIPDQRPGRTIVGMSAVLLPFDPDGDIAWDAFAAGVDRTAAAGLVPAVNMDTSYGPSLDRATRRKVLDATASALGGREPVPGWRFVAGAHVDDPPPTRPSPLDLDDYRAAVADVADAGGVPIVFPSFGLAELPEGDVASAHAVIAGDVDRLPGFELGRQFHPHGRIWSLDTYRAVLDIPQVVGAKHSSLDREAEWQRLALRDAHRPDFLVLTGNDLAIDMVRWGSDYLLGLSTFDPAAFALRDRLWAAGDPRALGLDDALQAIGSLAFRHPVPAYRHDAALVWHARGWAPSSLVHPASPTRPDGEAEILTTLLDRLDATVAAITGAAAP
jgi:dihydrodipicolinate synthase/N-acetylneuraminate lyase